MDSLVPEETHVVVAQRLPVARDALAAVEAFEIETDKDSEFAAVMLREIKDQYAAVEEERKKITGPLNQALRATNDFFRPVTTALRDAEESIKKKLGAYVREKREANMRALQVAATEKKAFASLTLVSTHAPAGIATREVWKFEITDPDAVPREFCSPDPKKIGAVAPETPIAGVRWFQEDVIASRKRT